MTADPTREIEQFLYREARLLDDRRFRDWLLLFTDDVRYWMPLRSSRFTRQSHAIATSRSRPEDRDISGEGEFAYLDETLTTLRQRIERLETGTAWAEEPPSRTRHIITNVEAEPGARDGEVRAYSNFVLFRSRLEAEDDQVAGQREDILRHVNGAWKISYRKIVVVHNVIPAKNLSVPF